MALDHSTKFPLNDKNLASRKRSKYLAVLAKEKLESDRKQNIKLIIDKYIFRQATVDVDPEGKGLSEMTIFRNPEVHQIFLDLSDKCQKRLSAPKEKKITKRKKVRKNGMKELTEEEYKNLLNQIDTLKKRNSDLLKDREQLISQNNNLIHYADELQKRERKE
jgi:hypothetical protein